MMPFNRLYTKRADRGIARGQMISEGNCGVLNVPKKYSNNFDLANLGILLVFTFQFHNFT